MSWRKSEIDTVQDAHEFTFDIGCPPPVPVWLGLQLQGVRMTKRQIESRTRVVHSRHVGKVGLNTLTTTVTTRLSCPVHGYCEMQPVSLALKAARPKVSLLSLPPKKANHRSVIPNSVKEKVASKPQFLFLWCFGQQLFVVMWLLSSIRCPFWAVLNPIVPKQQYVTAIRVCCEKLLTWFDPLQPLAWMLARPRDNECTDSSSQGNTGSTWLWLASMAKEEEGGVRLLTTHSCSDMSSKAEADLSSHHVLHCLSHCKRNTTFIATHSTEIHFLMECQWTSEPQQHLTACYRLGLPL